MVIRGDPSQDCKEPLSSVQLVLDPSSEEDPYGYSTRNKSPSDWERANIICRNGKQLHILCNLLEVRHGHLGDNPDKNDYATLMVFQFIFRE